MSAAEDFLSKRQVRLHIYRLPEQLNRSFAFGRGNAISFLNLDFFDAPWDIPRDELVQFIKGKNYYVPDARYLVLATSDYPTLSFTIEPAAEVTAVNTSTPTLSTGESHG